MPHPLNPRTHPQSQVDALDAALGTVGWIDRVKVNERTRRIVNGHARYELAIARGEPTVPVDWLDLDDAAELLALATFDPLTGLGLNDDARLSALLAEVNAPAGPLADMLDAMTPPEVRHNETPDPGAQIDRAEEMREKWQTERGQLWEIGGHRLMCGDSTDAADVARLMGGERAPLMATDPPYLVNYRGGNHPQSKVNKAEVKDKHWDDYVDPETGVAFYVGFLKAALGAALTPNPAIYQWHADLRRELVIDAWRDAGLLLHQIIVWRKARGVLTHSHFMWSHEVCAYGWVEGRGIAHKPPADERTVWDVDQQGESDNIHPTQKPRELFARPLRWHLPPGGLAYEPFSGSGTSLAAAEQEGRRCYAMEISPAFVAVALERMAGMGLEPKLL